MTDAGTRRARVRPSRASHPVYSAQAAHSESRRAWLAGACASAAALAAGSAAAFAAAASAASTTASTAVPASVPAAVSTAVPTAVSTAVSTPGTVAGAASAQADALPPAGGGLDAFVALSQKLTGRSRLNAVLAQRAYDALSKADHRFAQHVATLNTWLHTHGGVPSDTVIAALQTETPALANTVAAVVRAWYVGLVGEMPDVKVIAYESALMFDPVRDVLTVPSYCRDIPFYWSQKPTNA
jgi:fructose 5-dehydrogenase small subunit